LNTPLGLDAATLVVESMSLFGLLVAPFSEVLLSSALQLKLSAMTSAQQVNRDIQAVLALELRLRIHWRLCDDVNATQPAASVDHTPIATSAASCLR
jgi:hypothetical protein